jgi:hypothetical protein
LTKLPLGSLWNTTKGDFLLMRYIVICVIRKSLCASIQKETSGLLHVLFLGAEALNSE